MVVERSDSRTSIISQLRPILVPGLVLFNGLKFVVFVILQLALPADVAPMRSETGARLHLERH